MTQIIDLRPRIHARASDSSGYKSGRSALRGTPVARSIGSTNSAGTPRLDRVSQYQTCDCVVPIRSASGFWPPATSQARLSASVDMDSKYPVLGYSQPKTLCRTTDRNLGTIPFMQEESRQQAFGRRVRERRKDFGWGQATLGERSGFSQQNIGWIEKGRFEKDPDVYAIALSKALKTSAEWLLFGTGPKEVGPRPFTLEEFADIYKGASDDLRQAITDAVVDLRSKKKRA